MFTVGIPQNGTIEKVVLWKHAVLRAGVEPSSELVHVRPAELATGRAAENDASRCSHRLTSASCNIVMISK